MIKAQQQLVNCPECGKLMRLMTSSYYNYPNGAPRKFWRCRDKNCSGRHGAHPDGSPLGKPATKEVRQWRTYLHLLLEQRFPSNVESHRWLMEHGFKGHVGQMEVKEIWEVIELLEVQERN